MQHSSQRLKENPLVTIAIPTFNRASWVKACVAAALAQTYQNFEIVVSDNASTDNTIEVLQAIKDRRLRIIKQSTNVGPVANCNACIDAAEGDYIVLVPDDDEIAPVMLEKCVQLIRQAPEIPAVIAIGDVLAVANKHVSPAVRSKKLSTGIWDGADILLEYLDDRLSVHQCTVLLHTATLRAHGGFARNYPFIADIATWLPILMLGRAGLVNESCGTYCVHTSTQTSAFRATTRLDDVRRVIDLVRVAADKNIKDPAKRRLLENRAKGYFARHAIGLIGSQSWLGGSLPDSLALIRRWRKDILLGLPYVGFSNPTLLLINLALCFLPPSAISVIRRSYKAIPRSRATAEKRQSYSGSA